MNNFRSNPIQLNESVFIGPDEISEDIQILRVGTFFHEGKAIDIKKSHLVKMIKNYKDGVRGIDLMLDYSHESEKEAAAWFQDLYLSEDGKELWAKVDWTEDGADAVRKKKYRYISADFNFAYVDNEKLKDHGPTLLGAGLTNRPVVKKMNPTILSEHNLNEGNEMSFEEKFKKEEEKNKKLAAELAELKEDMKKNNDKKDDAKFSEKEADLKKREDAVKLSEEKIESDKKESAKKGEFDTMLSEGKTVEAQRDAFMKDDFAEFAKNAGSVNLSEKGNSGKSKDNKFADSDTPAQDEVISLAEKKVKEDKVEIGDAIEMVLSEDSKLKEKYEKEVEG